MALPYRPWSAFTTKGYEGAVVFGRQLSTDQGPSGGGYLCQALEDRARIPLPTAILRHGVFSQSFGFLFKGRLLRFRFYP